MIPVSLAKSFLGLTQTRPRAPHARPASLWRQRNELRHLSDAQLRDIGLTRDQANREARRWFWDVPDQW